MPVYIEYYYFAHIVTHSARRARVSSLLARACSFVAGPTNSRQSSCYGSEPADQRYAERGRVVLSQPLAA